MIEEEGKEEGVIIEVGEEEVEDLIDLRGLMGEDQYEPFNSQSLLFLRE